MPELHPEEPHLLSATRDYINNSWYVYIVRCADSVLYTGVTRDIKARINRHNESRGARFTKGRGPVRLTYSETFLDRGGALQREAEIKKLSRQNKERLIVRFTVHRKQ